MQLSLEPKAIEDVYRTPLVQQTAFWSRVKATLGMKSRAFEFSAHPCINVTVAYGEFKSAALHAERRRLDCLYALRAGD